MPTNFLWGSAGTVVNLLTTELNSLAVDTMTGAGPEINNSSGYQVGQLYLNLGSAAFVAGNYVKVFFVPSGDTAGNNYPTVGTAAQWAGAMANYLAGVVYINGTTAAQKENLRNVQIPLGKFKTYLLTSGACPTLAASGNTLDLYPTPSQY
jgi:hypothetical protein